MSMSMTRFGRVLRGLIPSGRALASRKKSCFTTNQARAFLVPASNRAFTTSSASASNLKTSFAAEQEQEHDEATGSTTSGSAKMYKEEAAPVVEHPTAGTVYQGCVDGFNIKKGFGFIRPDIAVPSKIGKANVFFRSISLLDRRIPVQGERIKFQLQPNKVKDGEYEAVAVEGGSGRIWN
ncbi:unnamed protein product [Amoebophrya sp. A25]|nr:unnamed protein product [Amoebophrya sp. A25]|eukprot:GSA25T00006589001.1